MIIVFVTLSVLLAIFFTIQYYFFGIDLIFAESLTISLIGSTLILVPTLFVLDKLIKKHDTRMLNKVEKERYKDNLSTRHDILVSNLEKRYIHYVTKKPAQTDKSLKLKPNEIHDLVNNLEEYISYDFLKNNYKVLFHGGNSIFDFKEQELIYQDFFVNVFRNPIYSDFNEFVSRYAALIPKEVLESIFKIEDTLKDGIFTVPNDHGIGNVLDVRKVKFQPEQFITPIRTIGEELVKLRKYLDD